MTKSAYPFANTPILTVAQWSAFARHWLGDGVLTNVLNELQVYADSTGMQVKVKSGAAHIKGHYYESDAEETLVISASDATNPRIDLVVLEVDWTKADNQMNTKVIKGTPAANPVIPSLTQTTSIWQIPLAIVSVGASVTTITSGNVSDLRVFAASGANGGGVSAPENSIALSLTNTYQDLVPATSSGSVLVSQILMSNEDTSVTADLLIKIVRSGVDYAVIQQNLAPGESVILNFPVVLDGNTKIQAKTSVTCSAHANAAYSSISTGIMSLVNFTGNTYTDVCTIDAGKKYVVLGVMIVNTDTTSQTINFRVLDAAAAAQYIRGKTLAPGAAWCVEPNLVMQAGWKLQVKHGAAGKLGSALVSLLEA